MCSAREAPGRVADDGPSLGLVIDDSGLVDTQADERQAGEHPRAETFGEATGVLDAVLE